MVGICSVCLLEQALQVMEPGFLVSEINEIRMEEVTGRKVVGYGKQMQSTSGLFHSSSIQYKQEKCGRIYIAGRVDNKAHMMGWGKNAMEMEKQLFFFFF